MKGRGWTSRRPLVCLASLVWLGQSSAVRNLFILLLIVVGLAIVRSLVNDVIQAVRGSLDSGDKDAPSVASEKEKARAKAAMSTGRLVKDPVSGVYIDERIAVTEVLDGETYFFETRKNRDEYVKGRRPA